MMAPGRPILKCRRCYLVYIFVFDIGLRVEARRGRLKRRGIKRGRNGDGFDGDDSHEPLLKRDDVLNLSTIS